MAERCVVVGAGGISNAWFGPLAAEGVQVAAVVDLNLDAARAQIGKWRLEPAEASSDLAAALARHQPDFVLDLTVPQAHAQVTLTALAAGCHVLGEKPMAPSLAPAREMVAAAEAAGLVYMVDQSRRWESHHEQVRRTLASGALGQITQLCCDFFLGAHFGGFRDEMESPLILDMAIHHFDLCRFFSGLDAEWVWAHEFNPRGSWYRGDPAACCVFGLAGGAVFAYRGSWCAEGCHTSWNGDWRVTGERGTLLYAADQPPRGQVLAEPDGSGFHRALADLAVDQTILTKTTMAGALAEMLTFLRGGPRPQTECHDNIKSLAMVEAALESARSGQRVAVG